MLLPIKETQPTNTPGSKKKVKSVKHPKEGSLQLSSPLQKANIHMETPEENMDSGQGASYTPPTIKVPSKKSLLRTRKNSARKAMEENKWQCGSCGSKNEPGSFSCHSCEGKLPMILLFKANTRNITLGEPIRLSWEVLECQSVTINPGEELLENKGILDVYPDETTEYILHAANEIGSRQLSLKVSLAPPNIQDFRASDPTVVIDYPTILQWKVENGAELSLNMDIGDVSGLSFTEAYLTQPGICTLTATNKSGTDVAEIQLFQKLPEISAFYALNQTIKAGEPNTLIWEVSNADKLILEPLGEDVTGQTSVDVFPDRTTTFTLKASNYSGEVSEKIPLTLPPPRIIHFMGNKSVSTEGEPIELSWEVENAYHVEIDNEIGQVDTTGKIKVKPTQAYTFFTLRAIGYSGEDAQTFQLTRFPIPLEESFIPASSEISAKMDFNEKQLQDSLSQIEQLEKELERKNREAQKASREMRIKRAQEMKLSDDMLQLEKASMRTEIQNIIRKIKNKFRSLRG
jgi:hypothetical protein